MPAELFANFRWFATGEEQTMLVENGVVVARDRAVAAEDVPITDLGGKWLAPAFVDPHCHILPTGLDLQKLHLGPCATQSDVLDLVRQRHAELPEREWLMAVHYDQTRYAEGHMHRDQLDAISATRPILLRHVNGHASVANSAVLRKAKVDESTPDPKGGTYVRDASGRLTGVLLERSHELVTAAAPTPTVEQMVDAILAAGEKMAALGIGCASDMMTGRYDLERELQAYQIAAQRGCPVRTRLYVQWSSVFGPRGTGAERLNDWAKGMDTSRVRVNGIKIFADGAIGSATAAIYGRFLTSPLHLDRNGGGQGGEATPESKIENQESRIPNQSAIPIDGQLMYPPDRLKKMVLTAHEAGFQIAIHSIGDRSTDLVMDALEATGEPSRHRIEHAMILSDAQIERMAKLGIHCCMQPEFLLRFGHSYKRQLGPERAARLKRMRSVYKAGIPLSFSSDRPIVAGDPMDGISMAVSRPEGFDPNEAVSVQTAFDAYTWMGAVANGEAGAMGTLEPGSYADLKTYETSPLELLAETAGTAS